METRVRTGLDTLWERTQQLRQHRRWDVRFTDIDPLPAAPGEPQRFRYATRVLPFLTVSGTGVSAGEKHRPDGTRTSALRFASPHPLSLIANGSGYWRYLPEGETVRFVTGYDYLPRWGRLGRLVDRMVFRPLIGWGTAWSFDRLRLWCERGITPERALRQALAEPAARLAAVVLTAVLTGPVTTCAVLAPALTFPPLPTTPAARRCPRRPPDLDTQSPPRLLDRLEHPHDLDLPARPGRRLRPAAPTDPAPLLRRTRQR
ncbi:hypothetical protein SMD11_0484 [Streptomyces albireticuli]|uniref:Membrane protein YndG n=1 Tax=Streptomyces albireticuli TaxID=1940 RepID=A0A1Z2KVV7_9ACTN|nr:hypothetical protein SMD11_0484 [Streptomyces albireticuli]